MKKLTTLFIITLGIILATFATPQETQADTLNEYTGTAFAKTFIVQMNEKDYMLALGKEDFYSFIPMEKAKKLNIKEGHVYNMYYMRRSFEVFAVVDYSAPQFREGKDIKELLDNNVNFTKENITATIEAEEDNTIQWDLGITMDKVTNL
ncbi:hypothetical protein EH802P2_00096 [Enterococcus phage EH802P2]|nr:hypothetical protein EH93P1_00091 [Enterococcus phage EH93P1]WAX15931.1 hypothetical protein EH93P2_00049 [Enterococcus phage EH93P2]WAX15999.1 hypothetical protein EH802P1_00003 [Enterococcus phage EH802P1]WAX16201.1 hypothetical protein EH802P2_00096 [Enterococcus phage EH802P2]